MDTAAGNLTNQGEPATGQACHINQCSVDQDALQDEVNSVGPCAGRMDASIKVSIPVSTGQPKEKSAKSASMNNSATADIGAVVCRHGLSNL